MTYIAGVGVARAATATEAPLELLVFQAAHEALQRAGVDRDAIDSLTLAASDQLDGRGISSMLMASPAGGYLVDEVRCTEDGAVALWLAAQRVEAGVSHHALVVSWTKSTESPYLAAIGVNAEPVYARPAGLHPDAVEAMEIRRYLDAVPLPQEMPDRLAQVRRTLAGLGESDGAGEVLATPLRLSHVPPTSDAAVAVLLTSEPSRVQLASIAQGAETSAPPDRTGPPGALLRDRARRAYSDAHLTDPAACRVVETTDRNVFRLAMSCEGLGLGSGADLWHRLAGGDLPQVNADGGLWRSNPPVAAALEATARAYRLLEQGFGRHAICHSSYGMAGNGQAVWVLEAVA